MEIDFNKQLERPRFIYKPNPMMKRAYQIFELMPKNNAYVPVGEYILLNHEEDPELTELKMGNLVLLLNGKKDVKDLSKMSSTASSSPSCRRISPPTRPRSSSRTIRARASPSIMPSSQFAAASSTTSASLSDRPQKMLIPK